VQHKARIYVIGGFTDDENLTSVAVYDIAAEEWSVLPTEVSYGRHIGAAAVHNNTIYVLGGSEDSAEESPSISNSRIVEVYDIAAGEWSVLPVEMKVGRNKFAAAVHGNHLYAVGGEGDDAGRSIEMLALPSLLPWIPTRHLTFPHSFKSTVFTMLCCFARTNALPEDMLFKIMRLVDRSAFAQPTQVVPSVL
jgi:hypothetical protein